jgi:hypothetical protein
MSYEIVYRIGDKVYALTRAWQFTARWCAKKISLRDDVTGWVDIYSLTISGRDIVAQYKNGVLVR